MKTPSASLRYPASVAALLAVVLASASSLHAATFTWDGGATGNSWGSADNWDPNGIPTFGNTADLVFNNLTRPTNYLGAARIVRSLSYGDNIDSAFGNGFQTFSGGTALNLTLESDGATANITVAAGSTGNITLGNISSGGSYGNLVLADDVAIDHNGSGTLLINRPISGAFGITKTGTGTLQLQAFNSLTGSLAINGGTVIAAAQSTTGQDLNTLSGINLGGGTLQVRPGFANKSYDTPGLVVSSASTLEYQGVTSGSTTYSVAFNGTSAFTLNADLTVKNTSTQTTLVNAINIARPMNGSGNMIVETYNNIASNTDSYGLGRVLLSGDNSNWSGNLVIAKGTVSLGGNAVNSAGTGSLTIGTNGDAFGAGLTFFPTGTNGSTVTYGNNITVRAGGFRSIKGSGTDHGIVLNGDIALEGSLNVDHTLAVANRFVTLGGDISGAGGLNITRAGGNASTGVLLNGTNTFLGATTVASGAALGGDGSVTSAISFASGANFIFNTTATLDVSGAVTFGGFGIANLIGLDAATVAGTYVLINGTGSNISQTNVSNIGLVNAVVLDVDKVAYFDFANGDLSLFVGSSAIPEPGSFALLGGVAALGLAGLSRRRRTS